MKLSTVTDRPRHAARGRRDVNGSIGCCFNRDMALGILTGEDGRYVPTGHLVYAIDTTLMALPFDPAARRITGGPVPNQINVVLNWSEELKRRAPMK